VSHRLSHAAEEIKLDKHQRPPPAAWAAWFMLAGVAVAGLAFGTYDVSIIAVSALLLSLSPFFIERLLQIDIPAGFSVAIAAFLVATLVLGEVGDFYERFWWWDLVLHTGSAIAFGLVGVVLMLVLLRGRKLEAAPITVAFFAFCFAVTVGTIWEIWEFFLDQAFGLNTQKSGLVDTMWDLIVNCAGAGIGAAAGFAHLKGWKGGPLAAELRAFARQNPKLFHDDAERDA